jgi:hypothetical protein
MTGNFERERERERGRYRTGMRLENERASKNEIVKKAGEERKREGRPELEKEERERTRRRN